MSMKGSRDYTGAAGKISDHCLYNCFLMVDTESDKTRGSGNLFQYTSIRKTKKVMPSSLSSKY